MRLCCLPSQFVRLDRQFDATPHLEVIEPQWARRIANSRSHRGCEKMRVEIVHTASGDGSDPCVSPRCAAAQPEALPPCSTNIPHVAASPRRERRRRGRASQGVKARSRKVRGGSRCGAEFDCRAREHTRNLPHGAGQREASRRRGGLSPIPVRRVNGACEVHDSVVPGTYNYHMYTTYTPYLPYKSSSLCTRYIHCTAHPTSYFFYLYSYILSYIFSTTHRSCVSYLLRSLSNEGAHVP